MKEQIKAFARSLQIEYTGIAPIAPDAELKRMLIERCAKQGATPFAEPDIEKRTNPACVMPGAKSIIVCLFPYANGETGAQNVSKYARIPDYHGVVKRYLNAICDFIRRQEPEASLLPFADNGPLVDKYLAYRAGLGFFGKNTLLINETYGSFCFIGYIITDLLLAPDAPLQTSCADCGACRAHCPGHAIGEQFAFCAQNCVSYITQLKTINEKQKTILASQPFVYGCDVCQDVCPHNRDIPKTPIPEFAHPLLESFEKTDIEGLSNRAFQKNYGAFPFAWRGKESILKNFSK